MDTEGLWESPLEQLSTQAYQPVTLPTVASLTREERGLRQVLADKAEMEDALWFLHAERAARFQGPGGAAAYCVADYRAWTILNLERARECAWFF